MKASAFILGGLLAVMGGIGGVEQSPDLTTLIQSTCICIVGMVAMWIGTSMVQHPEG